MNQELHYLTLPDRKLAYQQRNAPCQEEKRTSVFFLGGFASDMEGTKATALDQYCHETGYGYTRFDYRGHGLSEGRFEDGTLGDWLDDACQVFDRLTKGPQLVIGSSMGGWLGLLLARARPQRVAGLIGIAAAPDFTEDLIRPSMTDAQKEAYARDGYFYESHDLNLPITKNFMEESLNHLVLRESFKLDCPVHLIHGQRDQEVPWQTALRTAAHIGQEAVKITLVKDGDHRLSRPQDLAFLYSSLEDLMP